MAVARWFGERLALLVAAILVFVVGLVVWLHNVATSGPPFALSAMHARATVTVTTAGGAGRLLSAFTGRPTSAALLRPISRRQHLVLRVQFRAGGHASDGGQLALFVIDDRLHKPLSDVYGFGPTGSSEGGGWDGAYQRLADKYRWLAPLREVRDASGGYADPGMAVGWRPGTAGPWMIDAVMDRDAVPVTDVRRDVTVVLAYLGDSRGAWAERVPVTAG